MRVCEAHMRRAQRTLVDSRDGAEYDLCDECWSIIQPIVTTVQPISISSAEQQKHEIHQLSKRGRPRK